MWGRGLWTGAGGLWPGAPAIPRDTRDIPTPNRPRPENDVPTPLEWSNQRNRYSRYSLGVRGVGEGRVSQNCTGNRSRSRGDPRGPSRRNSFASASHNAYYLTRYYSRGVLVPCRMRSHYSGYFSFSLTLIRVPVRNLTASYFGHHLRVSIQVSHIYSVASSSPVAGASASMYARCYSYLHGIYFSRVCEHWGPLKVKFKWCLRVRRHL